MRATITPPAITGRIAIAEIVSVPPQPFFAGASVVAGASVAAGAAVVWGHTESDTTVAI